MKKNNEMMKLSPENRKIARRIFSYLRAHYMNEVTYEETVSDIVGMAEECDARGESFSDAIGDPDEFARELIKNSLRQSKIEQALLMIQWIWWCFLLIVPAIYVVDVLFPEYTPVSCKLFDIIMPFGFFIKYCVICLMIVLGIFICRRSAYRPSRLSVGVYLFVFIAVFALADTIAPLMSAVEDVRVNIIIWSVMFALLLIIGRIAARLAAFTAAYRREREMKKNDGNIDNK